MRRAASRADRTSRWRRRCAPRAPNLAEPLQQESTATETKRAPARPASHPTIRRVSQAGPASAAHWSPRTRRRPGTPGPGPPGRPGVEHAALSAVGMRPAARLRVTGTRRRSSVVHPVRDAGPGQAGPSMDASCSTMSPAADRFVRQRLAVDHAEIQARRALHLRLGGCDSAGLRRRPRTSRGRSEGPARRARLLRGAGRGRPRGEPRRQAPARLLARFLEDGREPRGDRFRGGLGRTRPRPRSARAAAVRRAVARQDEELALERRGDLRRRLAAAQRRGRRCRPAGCRTCEGAVAPGVAVGGQEQELLGRAAAHQGVDHDPLAADVGLAPQLHGAGGLQQRALVEPLEHTASCRKLSSADIEDEGAQRVELVLGQRREHLLVHRVRDARSGRRAAAPRRPRATPPPPRARSAYGHGRSSSARRGAGRPCGDSPRTA